MKKFRFIQTPILAIFAVGIIIISILGWFLIKSERQTQQPRSKTIPSTATSTVNSSQINTNTSKSVAQNDIKSTEINEFANYIKQRSDIFVQLNNYSLHVEAPGFSLTGNNSNAIALQNQISASSSLLYSEILNLQIPKLPDSLSNALVQDKILMGQYAQDISQAAMYTAELGKAEMDDYNDGSINNPNGPIEENFWSASTPEKFQGMQALTTLFSNDSQAITNNFEYVKTAATNDLY